MSQTKPLKWHRMDELAAREHANATQPPNVLYPVQLPLSAAPTNLQIMRGAVSYFASNFPSPVVSSQGVTIGGEIVLVRTDADSIKAYNFMVATSSDGNVYFSGPSTNFPGHHIQSSSSSPVLVSSLFGHSPAGRSRGP